MKNDLPAVPVGEEIARTPEAALAVQRAAYFAQPVPTLDERKFATTMLNFLTT